MEQETLKYIIQNEPSLFNYGAAIYKGGKRIASYRLPEEAGLDLIQPYETNLFQIKDYGGFFITDSFLAYALVKDKSSDLAVIIGPALVSKLTPERIRDITIGLKVELNQADKLEAAIRNLKQSMLEDFESLILTIYVIINQETTNLPALTLMDQEESKTIYEDTYKQNVEINDQEGELEGAAYSKYFEDRSVFFVKNGQPEKIGEIIPHAYKHRKSLLTPLDDIRVYKDRCISSLSILARAACEAGLDVETAYILTDLYLLKIETATSTVELNTIQFGMMNDLCKRVGDLRFKQTLNPTVNRAISYVNEHLREKLNTIRVAEALHISANYLSTYFKRETGENFMNYISRMKVEDSKRLLELTDKSLSDISNYLSFSSQSYFQNVFRNLTGMTPNDYRKKNKKDKAGN